jgi:hypothetical protein
MRNKLQPVGAGMAAGALLLLASGAAVSQDHKLQTFTADTSHP